MACGALSPLRAQLEGPDSGVVRRALEALAVVVRAGEDMAAEVLDGATLERVVHHAGDHGNREVCIRLL